MGYDQQAGGGWSGNLLLADWDTIENASNVSGVYILKFKSKEVFPVQSQGKFRFPLDEGVLCQPEPMDHTWLKGSRKRARPLEADDDEPAQPEDNIEEPADSSGPVPNAGGRSHFARTPTRS